MFPIVWLATCVVCAARTVPTASSQSGTVSLCATITETLLTVSGATGVTGLLLEHPNNPPPQAGNQ